MFVENDNQVEELNIDEMDYILPEGYDEESETFEDTTEEVEEKTEETEVKEEETTEENTETDEESEEKTEEVEETTEEKDNNKLSELLGFDTYKFNHEVKNVDDLTTEEVRKFMQLGMKESQTMEKLTIASEQNQDFADTAKLFNMDVQQLIDSLQSQYFDHKAKEEQRNVADVKKEFDSGRKDRVQKMYDRFSNEFPDIKISDIPQEVMQETREGKDLLEAYKNYVSEKTTSEKDNTISDLKAKVADLEKQLSVQKQNTKSKKKAVVKKSTGTESDMHDDFLEGLLG